MEKIKEIYKKKKYTEKIIQFGEGNFLRAFADWMVDKMNKEASFDGGIVVIQPLKDGLINVLNEQNGFYTLYLNGIKDNEVKREKTVIQAVSRGINPYSSYDEYLEAAKNPELRFILSNTTEAGISFNENDRLEDRPQNSFPGKLTAFLFERFRAFKGDAQKGLIFIPCELIDKNGQKIKEIILKYADLWNLGESFIEWINNSNTFCNSLVDRIVPGYPRDRIDEITKELGYEDRLVVEGEQFHLWVIEGPSFVKQEFPTNRAGLNVLFTDDLTPYRTRKVRILNGAHTSMVPVSLLYGLETVRETVEDEVMGKFVKGAIFEEIVPTLDLPEEELNYFANAVLDRFKNPFIKHLLMSISLNSNSKYETRVLPSVLEYQRRKGKLPKKLVFSLAALIRFFRGDINGRIVELKEKPEIISMYKELWGSYDGTESGLRYIVEDVLAQENIWKMNLNTIEGLTDQVTHYLMQIEALGMKQAINEVI